MCFGPSTLVGAGAKPRLNTPKAATYHEQYHTLYIMIGHSLGRMESKIKKFTPHMYLQAGTKLPRGVDEGNCAFDRIS